MQDTDGNVYANYVPVAEVTDRAGVGNWSKDLSFRMRLLPGKYFVGLYAIDPTVVDTDKETGVVTPRCESHMSILMTVK